MVNQNSVLLLYAFCALFVYSAYAQVGTSSPVDAESSYQWNSQLEVPFFCVSGTICKMAFNTRMGEMRNAHLNAFSIAGLDGADVFMESNSNTSLIGVPLKAGQFQYVLGYSDKNGKIKEVPFEVTVLSHHISNHHFTFVMDTPSANQMHETPRLRIDFIWHLAKALKGFMSSLTVSYIGEFRGKTMVIFFNNTISDSTCNCVEIQRMKKKMMVKKNGRTKAAFIQNMGHAYSVRLVGLETTCQCNQYEETTTIASTTALVVTDQSWTMALKGTLVALLLLLILCIVGVAVLGWPERLCKKRSIKSMETVRYVINPNMEQNSYDSSEDVVFQVGDHLQDDELISI